MNRSSGNFALKDHLPIRDVAENASLREEVARLEKIRTRLVEDYSRIVGQTIEAHNELAEIELHRLVEQELREENPALQNAWDAYQIILRMVKTS